MDARIRFKSFSQPAQATPAHADDDEDWDAVIARARMQAASPTRPSLRPVRPRRESPTAPYAPLSSLSRQADVARHESPSPRSLPPSHVPPELQETPPPLSNALPKAPRVLSPEKTKATLNGLVGGGLRRPTPPPPSGTVSHPGGLKPSAKGTISRSA